MNKPIIIRNADLMCERTCAQRNLLSNEKWVEYFDSDFTIIEGVFEFETPLFIKFIPEMSSEYWIILQYQSNNRVNSRINSDLPINIELLDKQSNFACLFLGGNVGVDFMLPANSVVDFQLVLIRKNRFTNNLKALSNKIEENFDLIIQSNLPVFYFFKGAKISYILNHINSRISKRDFVIHLLTKLWGENKNTFEEDFSLLDFYQVLRIEHLIRMSKSVQNDLFWKSVNDSGISHLKYLNVFKKVFNKSLEEYQQEVLMEYAKILLKTENKKSIAEIAEQLGYVKSKSFWQSFKRKNSICPEKYRRSII